jgi:hypothetical protein
MPPLTLPWTDTSILCVVPDISFSIKFSKLPHSSLCFLNLYVEDNIYINFTKSFLRRE